MRCVQKKIALAFGSIVLLVIAPSPLVFGQQTKSASAREAAEEDIREAVLRSEMLSWAENGDKDEAEAKDESEKEIAHALNFKVFFIDTGAKEPSDEFLKRFHDIPRIVKRASSAQLRKVVRMPVVDKETGVRGIIFSADEIHWRGKHHVKVEGGYHCDGLCGAGITYDVRFKSGKWVVKHEKMNWIS